MRRLIAAAVLAVASLVPRTTTPAVAETPYGPATFQIVGQGLVVVNFNGFLTNITGQQLAAEIQIDNGSLWVSKKLIVLLPPCTFEHQWAYPVSARVPWGRYTANFSLAGVLGGWTGHLSGAVT